MNYVYAIYRRDYEGEVYMPLICADEFTAILAKVKLSRKWHSDSIWYIRMPLTGAEDF